MILVSGGHVRLGATEEEARLALEQCQSMDQPHPFEDCSWDRLAREIGTDSVEVEAFYIDVTEVTVEQYEACIAAGHCTEVSTADVCEVKSSFSYANAPRRLLEWPINCVAWEQAVAYCTWQDKRLPTAMEWERAARGDDGRLYPWGNEPPSCERVVAPALLGCRRGAVTGPQEPVGALPDGASPFGALDMAGNVAEWTATESESRVASDYVVKGGDAEAELLALRSAAQGGAFRDEARPDIGFRCAKSLSDP